MSAERPSLRHHKYNSDYKYAVKYAGSFYKNSRAQSLDSRPATHHHNEREHYTTSSNKHPAAIHTNHSTGHIANDSAHVSNMVGRRHHRQQQQQQQQQQQHSEKPFYVPPTPMPNPLLMANRHTPFASSAGPQTFPDSHLRNTLHQDYNNAAQSPINQSQQHPPLAFFYPPNSNIPIVLPPLPPLPSNGFPPPPLMFPPFSASSGSASSLSPPSSAPSSSGSNQSKLSRAPIKKKSFFTKTIEGLVASVLNADQNSKPSNYPASFKSSRTHRVSSTSKSKSKSTSKKKTQYSHNGKSKWLMQNPTMPGGATSTFETPIDKTRIAIGSVFAVLIFAICFFIFLISQKNNAIFLAEHSKAKFIKRPRIAVCQSFVSSNALGTVKLDDKKLPWSALKLNYNADIVEIPLDNLKSRTDFINRLAQLKEFHIIVLSQPIEAIAGPLDGEIISHLPASTVAVIQSSSSSNHDSNLINSLTDRNIQLSYYDLNTELKENSTADTHAFLMLSAMRNYKQAMYNLLEAYKDTQKAGQEPSQQQHLRSVYSKSSSSLPSNTISAGIMPNGQTLGILGMNGVGKALAARMKPFNFERMIYHDKYKLPAVIEDELGLEYVRSKEELLASANIISLTGPPSQPHLSPLSPSLLSSFRSDDNDNINNHALYAIDSAAIAQMQDGVVIVSTVPSEFNLIDFKSLKKQLSTNKKHKKIHALAMDSLDLFNREAVQLLEFDNVVVMPQMSLHSQEVAWGDDEWIVRNIKHFLETGKVLNGAVEQQDVEFKFDYFVQ